MASASHLLLLLSFIYYASINGDSFACPSFDCGDGLTITYPFWHQTQQQLDHCGYPGFNLTCNDQKTIFHLPNHGLYPIKLINYSINSLFLSYNQEIFGQSNCPKTHYNFSSLAAVPHFLFNYTVGNKILHFFYNCTLFPPSLPDITCLRYSAKRSYVFVEGSVPEFDWHGYCESTATVPALDAAAGSKNMVQDFGQALADGFRLTWLQPDRSCQSCEDTGGFCGYTNGAEQHNNNFFCVCASGRRLSNCNDEDAASIRFEPNYVAIGALLFGGSVAVATTFYFYQKRKILSYKPV